VTINGDTTGEFDESFLLRLTEPTNAGLSATEATATILMMMPC
jgi:hypothetical protein